MPEKSTKERAREQRRAGKAPTTQAGEFVREEIHHVREGKHGVRSPRQAIAIGLSKARRAGVRVPPKKSGGSKARRQEERDLARGRKAPARRPSPRRSRAVEGALKREGREGASTEALSRQGRRAARARRPGQRREAARKASATKTPEQRSRAAKKAASRRTPEQRSASAKKAAATRRRNRRRAEQAS